MKVSLRWLRELLGVPTISGASEVAEDAAEVARRLTAAGLEVEGQEAFGSFSGVIVGEVRGRRRHPQADKLTLVDVWDGREVTQVVCGALNVPAPDAPTNKVAWARPGARLPDGRVLEARDVRGIVSPGMLCAEDELGLGTSHEGIIHLDAAAEPGADLAGLLGLPDVVLELNVTPNRGDCLGHLGVSREVAALFGLAFAVEQPRDGVAPTSDVDVRTLASVDLVDVVGCPRYLARVIEGVRVAQSPLALRLRLQALGVRAINDVVDATNLVLLETGHPLHAFDLDKVAGRRIVVRRAREGEPIVTLDGQERRLTAEDVAICDGERPVAVAGVMGGHDSEVDTRTKRLLLESAYFDPPRIRRTARRLGLRTEASQRFERGADPNLGVELASLRCARLIGQLSGGRTARGALDAYPRRIEPVRIALRPVRTDLVLGIPTEAGEQARLLRAIEIDVTAGEGDMLQCSVPTFRPDLTREIDLIEEVARLRGYDVVPAVFPALRRVAVQRHDERPEAARDALVAVGFSEAITYAFVGPDRIAALGFKEGDRRAGPLRLENPLREEHSALRTSLIPGLLAATQRNFALGTVEQRLFEVGMVFLRRTTPAIPSPHLPPHGRDDSLPEERRSVAGAMTGRRPGWLKPGEEYDFFDLKGVVESLLQGVGAAEAVFRAARPGEAPWLHPGLSAAIVARGETAGVLGEVHPAVRDRYGIEARCFAFEVDLERLGPPSPIRMREVPRYPGSSRDVSFFVDEEVPAADLAEVMRQASPLVESVRPLEDYREPAHVHVPPGRKGMLLSLRYRSRDRTLTDEDVNREHARVLAALKARFAIEQR